MPVDPHVHAAPYCTLPNAPTAVVDQCPVPLFAIAGFESIGPSPCAGPAVVDSFHPGPYDTSVQFSSPFPEVYGPPAFSTSMNRV